MKKTLLVLAALAFVTPAGAAPPTAEQKAEFLATCLKVAPEAGTLCTCKADAAMSLVDSEFMAVIIASMQGKDVPAALYDTYNDYIARSTQACGMGSAM
ncbi:MAG: hypothetical protein J0I48_14950 [Devosia sp.]|jgi:hypothetical protein|uniref:hypothetical protein n=1 Tax=unclassified Devosia TaxID=196773 RepID=UPI0009276F36|nr:MULTISPECIES: hypothetical protein [unclassified Devosia]MBL8598416.1 hypothetical protein [Devosia sp.]MBN9347472.1 hypothetical protein [Devosia sp.]MCC7081983.1 hypothetical protein [Burkholderiales bacterium]OJX46467.1 MAG: hypothetical protein BGO81_03655 [Devosia sp. 66-22]